MKPKVVFPWSIQDSNIANKVLNSSSCRLRKGVSLSLNHMAAGSHVVIGFGNHRPSRGSVASLSSLILIFLSFSMNRSCLESLSSSEISAPKDYSINSHLLHLHSPILTSPFRY